MSGISALVTLLSIDVCASLVAAGYAAAPSVAVAGASNAAPVVLTTAAPHGFTGPVHASIAGIVGTTSANGTFLAIPTTLSAMALYSVSATGVQAPVAGNASYISGGTVTLALTDGRILLGREHVMEQSSAPRIVFIPMASKFGVRTVYSRANVAGQPSAEILSQWQQRSIATDFKTFEIHCWGINPAPESETADFDSTEVLYDQVIASTHKLTVGSYALGAGKWTDSQVSASQLYRSGREFVFSIEIGTPVLDILLPYAPNGTGPGPMTVKLQPADGSPPEVGFQG